jgi:trk system potassium uptake protein TrkH
MSISENLPLDKLLFEVTSAIGTVGLSTGITGSLSGFGKAVLIFNMFIGRLGLLTFGLAILAHRKNSVDNGDEADLAV